MRPWQSLKYELPLLITTLLCTVVVAVCWSGYRQLQDLLIQTEGSRLTGSTERLIDMLEVSIRGTRYNMRRLAADSAVAAFVGRPDDATARAARRLLAREQARSTRPVSFLLLDRDARPLLAVGPLPSSETGDRSPLDPASRGQDGPAGTWVGPLIRRDSVVLYQVTAPVFGAARDTTGFLVTYRQLNTGQGVARISGVIGPNTSLLIGNAEGEVWTDLAAPVPGPSVRLPAGVASEYATAGVRWLGVEMPIRSTPWLVRVRTPRATALGPAARIARNLACVAGIFVALGALLAWLLSRRVTAPLAEMSEAAEDLARGDYARRVTVAGRGEMGSLARSFNSMAAQVQAASRELQAHAGDLEAANAELRESEHRYRQLVEILPDAIIVNRDGIVRYVNPAAVTLFGADDPESLIGRAVVDLVVDEERADVAQRMARAQGEGQAFPVAERRVRRLDGTTCTVEGASTPLLIQEGPAVLSILRDVSERKRLESRILQVQKMEAVGQLAGGVAHDFNNLLTVITSYSGMLLGELPPGDPTREDVAEIAGAAERAAALTRQLLAFGRQQMLQPRVLEPNQIITDMEKMLRRVLPAHVHLTTRLSTTPGCIRVDPGQLEQVVMNLVLNARDAMPDGGRVVIETAAVELGEDDAMLHAGASAGPYVTITVSDTGCGMDEETRARLFEPFFTTKEPGKGTGLGLPTVYGIVTQSGGHVWVYSEPGQGTVFRIYLPRVDGPASRPARPSGTVAAAHAARTILLAEDEAPVRAVARRILERAGYTVLAAASGAEALGLCEEHGAPVDLLLTDMVMPDISGRELAVRFRERHPEAPVVFMSGYTEDAVLRHGVDEPGAGFLQKPFTPQTLTTKLHEILGQATADRAG